MSLTRCKHEHKSSELPLWIYYLDHVYPNEFSREIHHLAQIAEEVKRSWIAKPEGVAAGSMVIPFKVTIKEPPKKLSKKEAAEASKARVFAMTGHNPVKKTKTTVKRNPPK